MKINGVVFLIIMVSQLLSAQWSSDGYFMEGPSCHIWGTYETVEESSNFGGVFYRIRKSQNTIINVNPDRILPGGGLYLRWIQYRAYQNAWYYEYSGEMIVSEILLPLNTTCPGFRHPKSPTGKLIEGVFSGQIRTLLKYISGTPYPAETAWAPISFTVNGGAINSTGFNPYDGLLDGYVMSKNGNIYGDFVLFREPQTGAWGCLNGQYLHYYSSGGRYVTVICPQEFNVNTGEVKGIFNRYRVNSSNMDRSKGIWRVKDWKQDISGEIVIFRIPLLCPTNIPSTTPSGFTITACLDAKMKTNYIHSEYSTIEARESWVPYVFTLTAGSTSAPTTLTADPCDLDCQNFCNSINRTGGQYNGSTVCLLGVVSDPYNGCDCN